MTSHSTGAVTEDVVQPLYSQIGSAKSTPRELPPIQKPQQSAEIGKLSSKSLPPMEQPVRMVSLDGAGTTPSPNTTAAGAAHDVRIPVGDKHDGPFPLSAEKLTEIVNFDNREKPELLETLKQHGGVEGLAKMLKTDVGNGLSGQPADLALRREAFGSNKIPPPPAKSFLGLVWQSLQDRVLQILIVGGLVTLVVGCIQDPSTGWHEGISISVTVGIVVLCTCGNDWSKERKFRKIMEKATEKQCKAMRNGEEMQITSWDVAVGDVVVLATGDEVPADGLFISGRNLTIDESPLTGETIPVKKGPEHPFMFAGTQVTEGSGKILITTVGRLTTGGQIQELLNSQIHQETPLQEQLSGMAVKVSKIGTLVSVLTFIALSGWWIRDTVMYGWQGSNFRGDNGYGEIVNKRGSLVMLVDNIVVCITLLLVAVPDGLPLATTLSLAHGMTHLLKLNNFVRNLHASETMGQATCICSDKTGTLTENRMTVVRALLAGRRLEGLQAADLSEAMRGIDGGLAKLLGEGIATNSTCFIEEDPQKPGQLLFVGSKTEGALLVFAQKIGTDYKQTRARRPVQWNCAFSSDRKRMSTAIEAERGPRLHVKGASEIVLGLCGSFLTAEGERELLDAARQKEYADAITEFASEGLRTIGIAYRDLEGPVAEGTAPEAVERDLTLVAIVGIKDPVRAEVPPAVRACQRAGLVVRMVTGDNILTARKISQECGILLPGGLAMEGPEFRAMSEEERDKVIPKLQVLARSSPADKYILVKALKRMGEVVAVTGDGTNDAPALKEADIGFAMGISGTDIAKNACDIVLLDDNFASVVSAIRWGRNVYDCIRKFLQFQFAINVVSCLITLLGAATNKGTPLNAVMLLWINLIMDTLGALAIATDMPEDDVLERKPGRKTDPVLTKGMLCYIFSQAAWQFFVLVFILYHGYTYFGIDRKDVVGINTIIFNVNILMQIVNETNGRHLRFRWNLFSNIWRNPFFVPIMVVIFAVQILLVQVGYDFVGTHPLNIHQWVGCCVVALAGFPMGWISQALHDRSGCGSVAGSTARKSSRVHPGPQHADC